MTEVAYVEKPVLEWLGGRPGDPDEPGLGWTRRSAAEMDAFGRDPTDPLVEALLVPAIVRINDAVTTEEQARRVVAVFRSIVGRLDPLDANRGAIEALREGIPIVLAPGEPATTVRLVEFRKDRLHLNDFTITNQFVVKGTKGLRADTVLLVNGIPLVLAEYKSYVGSRHDWTEGVNQVHRYLRDAPQLLAPNVFCVAADELEFRYGTVAHDAATQGQIDAQRDHWQPWLSQYPVVRQYWNLPASERDDDAVRTATRSLLRPDNVLDVLEHFVVFETKRGRVTKKVARYQQFEAANDIVDRVLAGDHKTGLIWHTQGSGKSLTQIFAAYKLRRRPELENPTVMIVVDRVDLKTQIGDEFDNCDYPNVERVMTVRDLKDVIANERRGTFVTTVQCFQNMGDLPESDRDNVVLLIDEAHRSQKGETVGFAMTMRAKLPNAFRFGLTGTPIDRAMTNTHRQFGPVVDGELERYLSYYGIRQSILDGATLEVYYEPRTVPIVVDEENLDISFEQMCADQELDDEEEKDLLQRREARWKALVKDPRRIEKVIDHMVEHFLAHPDPSGFKAQLVAVDREACALYKDRLDAALAARGRPAAWSEVIISARQNEIPGLERFHYTRERTQDILEKFKMTPDQHRAWNRARVGDDETKWEPPVKILIVCDKLLTGFDAPVEQVMYLDKPLRDHNLLQAMARTNRPFPQMGKRNGLVVDYFGVFEDLRKALNYDESIREEAAIDWERLKEQVPAEIGRCLGFFHGIKIETTRECLLACLRRLSDPKTARDFEAQFARMQTLWEALAPDECLYPFRHDYAWVCGMYVAHRRRNRRSRASHEELAAKTRELIQRHTEFMRIAEDVPVLRIDEKYLEQTRALPTVADRAAELEAALNRELIEGEGSFHYRKLGERLKKAIEEKQAGDEAALRYLQELEALVQEVNDAKQQPARLGLTGAGEYPLFTVVRGFAAGADEETCARAPKTMMAELQRGQRLPPGWSNSASGRKKVGIALQMATYDPDVEDLNLCPVDQTDPPFIRAAVEELARALP